MDAAPDLRVIGVHGSGIDPVEVDHATRLGIPVLSTPTANTTSVAEQVLALMFAVAKRTNAADSTVREARFDFKYHIKLAELSGKTLGVIGWGRVGRTTARMTRAGFGMRLLVYSPNADVRAIARDGGEKVDSLHCLLSRSTSLPEFAVASETGKPVFSAPTPILV